ncbi:hypothetical protein SKAU_G00097190 [Synaphobranchus kaupii]|uniref:Uncharacterized protein n=1 Tax=Synaphobranchus kaupii TaxID=118154 RepID=A0A9Q1J716_SYNKA|nr:hypothetical protein SKAU_G00097190 [Synaphobranchus kaupii]
MTCSGRLNEPRQTAILLRARGVGGAQRLSSVADLGVCARGPQTDQANRGRHPSKEQTPEVSAPSPLSALLIRSLLFTLALAVTPTEHIEYMLYYTFNRYANNPRVHGDSGAEATAARLF